MQSAVPLERNPIGTKAQQNENMCPIRSKEAFVLTGFRSDGPTPLSQPYVATGHTNAVVSRIFVEIGML